MNKQCVNIDYETFDIVKSFVPHSALNIIDMNLCNNYDYIYTINNKKKIENIFKKSVVVELKRYINFPSLINNISINNVEKIKKLLELLSIKDTLLQFSQYNSILKKLNDKDKEVYVHKLLFKLVNENKLNIDNIELNTLLDYRSFYNNKFEYYSNIYRFNNLNIITVQDTNYPQKFKEILESDKNIFVSTYYIYEGNINLLNKNENNFKSIIGTRNIKNIHNAKNEIQRIKVKYPNNICVTGLASGIDSLAVNAFDKSICFIGENITCFISKKQKDIVRRRAKELVLKEGLILSHILPSDPCGRIDNIKYLLQRNNFISILSDSIHPIEFGIKSGTINAINTALMLNRKIYSPKSTLDEEVIYKYKDKITFY